MRRRRTEPPPRPRKRACIASACAEVLSAEVLSAVLSAGIVDLLFELGHAAGPRSRPWAAQILASVGDWTQGRECTVHLLAHGAAAILLTTVLM